MKEGFDKAVKIGVGIITFAPLLVPVFFVLCFVFLILISSCGHKEPPVTETTSAVVTTEEPTTEEPTTEETTTEEPTTERVTLSDEELSSIRAEQESRLDYLQSIDEYDEIIDIGYDRGRDDGYYEGYKDGYREGYDEGFDDGSDSGYEEGEDDGYYRGLFEGDD